MENPPDDALVLSGCVDRLASPRSSERTTPTTKPAMAMTITTCAMRYSRAHEPLRSSSLSSVAAWDSGPSGERVGPVWRSALKGGHPHPGPLPQGRGSMLSCASIPAGIPYVGSRSPQGRGSVLSCARSNHPSGGSYREAGGDQWASELGTHPPYTGYWEQMNSM